MTEPNWHWDCLHLLRLQALFGPAGTAAAAASSNERALGSLRAVLSAGAPVDVQDLQQRLRPSGD